MLLFKYLFKNFYLFLTSAFYRKFIFLLGKYGGVKRYQHGKVSLFGKKFLLADHLSFIWQYKEIFVDQFYDFPNTKSSPIIFDCGANIGTSCLFYKIMYPNAKILAFEADPAICNVLSDNVNAFSMNVELVGAAVWNKDGEIELNIEGADGASVVAVNNSSNLTKVKSVRLRDWITRYSLIDFLKMDIEGAEYEVIMDCKEVLHKINYLFVEYHSIAGQPQNLDEILSTISSAGFRYILVPVHTVVKPFYHKSKGNNVDFQINIFATNNNIQ